MKTKDKLNPFWRIFIVVSALGLLVVGASVGLYYYIFAIPEPEGLSLASWPHIFTDNFSGWMRIEDENIKIQDIGLERLNQYGLWLQVIDGKGQEVFAYHKPSIYPQNYSASELMTLSASPYENGHTIFVSQFESGDTTWGYIIGFPYAIGKYTLYYNGGNVGRLSSPLFRMGVIFILSAIVFSVILYVIWLTKHLDTIIQGIRNISFRTYIPFPKNGVFGNVYETLNEMNEEICRSDQIQKETEQSRKEWITNITHDLKTPFSPIKGYAELLVDNPMLESQTIQEYGEIILKNTNYAEKLINDLKLTYQLESGVIPCHRKEVRLVRYLKELVIDIINDPAFLNRDIVFESDIEELIVQIDPDLFRRAIQNIIINALIHNPTDRRIVIGIYLESQDKICILIKDNGIGMSQKELTQLWNRYYRGTNTKEKSEGSGLGLAIAKQIITLHQGEITVKSELNKGTQFIIVLPLK